MLMLFLTVALVHIVALMSPGPDFFFVSQTAVSRSRKEAMMGVQKKWSSWSELRHP